jgi:hypothetical protein
MNFFVGISMVILSLGIYNMMTGSSGINKTKLKGMLEMAYFDGQIDYAEGDITIKKDGNGVYVWDKEHEHYKALGFKEGNPDYYKYLEERQKLDFKKKKD